VAVTSLIEIIGLGISMCYYATTQYPPACGNLTNISAIGNCSTAGVMTLGMSIFIAAISVPAVGGPLWFVHTLVMTRYSRKYYIPIIWLAELLIYLSIAWFAMPFSHKIIYPHSMCDLMTFYTGMRGIECFGQVILGVVLVDGIVIGLGLVGYGIAQSVKCRNDMLTELSSTI
jgi:hypothetical protein